MLGGHPHPVVGHREGHVDPLPRGGDPDGGQVVGVAGRVGEQVGQHLHHPPPVRRHPGQTRRQVDHQVAPSAPALEPAPGLVHQDGDLHRFRGYRQGPRLDAGHVQQVADQVAHALRLVPDDPEELGHLRRVQVGGILQQGVRRALDGRQGGPELVAHHPQELGPQPLQVLQRRQVLYGNDHRLHLPLLREDGSGVDQGGDAAPVGGLEHDLLGPHRLPGDQGLGQGQLPQGDLPPVGPPVGQHLQKLLRRPARLAQAADDPPRLPVDGHRVPRPGVQDQHAHRRGVHQGLQVGPGPLLVAVAAGVGDDQGRLGGEHHQGLLVLGGELDLLLAHVDAPDALPPVAERRGQEGQGRAHRHRRAELGQAQRPARSRGSPCSRSGSPMLLSCSKKSIPLGNSANCRLSSGVSPEVEEVLYPPRIVQEGDDPVAGAGQRPGAVQDPLEHRPEVQALVDAQAGLAEAGQPLPQGLVFPGQLTGVSPSPRPPSRSVRPAISRPTGPPKRVYQPCEKLHNANWLEIGSKLGC